MEGIDALIERVRERYAPDRRTAVFEIAYEVAGADLVLTGATTEAAAAGALVAGALELVGFGSVVDHIRALPDPALAGRTHALVRAAVAPLLAAPRASATQVSQRPLGARVEILERQGAWFRVRGADGYLGWTHHGYLTAPGEPASLPWRDDDAPELAFSLHATLVDDDGRLLARLPWGARVAVAGDGRYRLPDGRAGVVAEGVVVPPDERRERFPAAGPAVARSARAWLGTPYVWGGVTTLGADCSGFVQTIFAAHGVSLPRDSDMQARCGDEVAPGDDFAALAPGDLLFFAEPPGQISHVAISLGGGRIVHAAISNGGVAEDDLTGDYENARRLRSIFVVARRVLPG